MDNRHMQRQIYVGFDPREAVAYWVAVESIRRRLSEDIPIHGLELSSLCKRRLYQRPMTTENGQLYDEISQHTMSTEFALSRFLVPILAKEGWALFMDCDMLARCDLVEVFKQADPKYAVMCVKHEHRPTSDHKMQNQTQSWYPRKNWSSFCLFNCDHPANELLTLDMINNVPGLHLHGFRWLKDEEIGALDPAYNFLVGYDYGVVPKVIHYTEGGPWFPEYAGTPYGAAWWRELREIVAE